VAFWVFHVDLDQFIAAVEVLRRPELRGLPVVVGGDGDPSKRGVVSTASYEARAYGVESGMPLRTAARRCPDAVFLPVDAEAYLAASDAVMSTLKTLGTEIVVEVVGWDEAFVGARTDEPEALARRMQAEILARTRLHCTVGIGQNKPQAKLATGLGKPAGVFRLTHATWFEVLGDRPTSALWGIGAKTAKKLAALGISTVRELAEADPQYLAGQFGPATGPWLIRLAQGLGDSAVSDAPYVARSRSRETTYQTDVADWDRVRDEVAALARELAGERPVARVVVKVRYAPFFTHTHGHTLAEPTTDPDTLERAALAVLDLFTEHKAVRLLGVRVAYSPM
jgi:DNA polymerase-4